MMRQLTFKKKKREKVERMKENGKKKKPPHITLPRLVSHKQSIHTKKMMFCESSLFLYLPILLFDDAF